MRIGTAWMAVGICLSAAGGSACLSAAPPRRLVPAAPPDVRGEFVELSGEWKLTLNVEGNRSTWPHHRWLHWGALVENRFDSQVVLVDGSRLVGRLVAVSSTSMVIDQNRFDLVTVPRNKVAGIIVRPPVSPAARDRLEDWIERRGGRKAAVLRLIDGDELPGRDESEPELPDPLPLELVTLAWQAEGLASPIAVRLDKIAAIRWTPAMHRPAASSAGTLGLDDGSRLAVTRVVADRRRFECRLACGIVLKWARDLTEHLVYVRPPARHVRYLSDSPPVDHRHIPLLEQTVPYRLNRSADGTRLRSGGHLHEFGIGTFGRNRVVYNVPPGARALSVTVGIDAAGDRYSSVIFRIYVVGQDGTPRQAAASRKMRLRSSPQRLVVGLEGARQVVLIVDTSDWLDRRDVADWLDACWIMNRGGE